MRMWGSLLLVVALTSVFVLFLQSQDATESLHAVNQAADALQEENVVARTVDRDTAKRVISSLETLVANPSAISANLEALRQIAGTAASWAKAAPSPSADLHMAVAIRAAAGELRAYAATPSESSLNRARAELVKAREGLLGQAGASGPEDAMADRLHNLETAQRERYQEVSELGN
jgi:hypothetical protein